MHNIIPKPTSLIPTAGNFSILPETQIVITTDNEEVAAIGMLLASYLKDASQFNLSITNEDTTTGKIMLKLEGDPVLGDEGYELSITSQEIVLQAQCPAGLFYGVQTLRQLLPTEPSDESSLPAVSIRDFPRFEWRGAMLDVARHFFGVEDVKHFIDLISHYKLNRLHLHLTDDQGWRIEIKSWPRLAEVGGRSQVGGGGGGYYTQEQYKEIVDFGRSRHVTVVPEIDTPGHTNAALASYAELNESEEAPALYEDTKVGFSTLWINADITYKFLDDVIRELAALTPTPYIHIGGDEARSTPEDQYKLFVKRMQEIVRSHGKIAVGWNEIGEAELFPGTIAQQWDGKGYEGALRQGAKIILSPAKKIYLDMKYDASTPLGLDWAGLVNVKNSYDWEPDGYLPLLEEKDILGLEAPLWTETVQTVKDIEYMVFPRLLGVAELAWSSKGQSWDEYRERLASHGKRLEAMGVHFYRSPDVDWE